jgi:hypothetical protein
MRNEKSRRQPGAMAGNTKEMGERLRLSRERLMASELAGTARAWRLWAACVDATVGYTREADATYVVGLARRANMERQVASKLLRRFSELGVFQWRSGPRGSHTKGLLTLPASGGQSGTMGEASGGQSGTMSPGPQGVKVAPLHSNELSVEGVAQGGQEGPAGAQRGTPPGGGPGAPGSGLHRGAGQPEGQAPEPGPAEVEAFWAAVEAEPGPAGLAERFAPWHGDERTGDGVGDDEAAQVRHQAANPRKARRNR